MSKDTMVRALTAFAGLVLFFLLVFSTKQVLNTAIIILILIMIYEFLRACKCKTILIVTAMIASLVMAQMVLTSNYRVLAVSIIAYISILGIEAILFHKDISFADIAAVFFATVYISVFTAYISRARRISNFGIYYMFLIFACAWMSDTGGYFVGRIFGRRKLAPEISPKKTLAGSVGAVLSSSITCIIFGVLAQFISYANPDYVLLFLIGVWGSCIAQCGDLLASIIKRECGIKDFGNVMPGHGGLLDRFDSVIITAPFIYYTAMLLNMLGMKIL